MAVSDWSTTPASNNASPPNGAPEGMAPSTVNDTIRQIMADVRSFRDTVQNFSINKIGTIAGTDTITGALSPAITAYTAGMLLTFVPAATNTGAVTLNVNALGPKAITRNGTTALSAGDILIGQELIVIYDGTQFQVVNPNAFSALSVVTPGGKSTVSIGNTAASTYSQVLMYGGDTHYNWSLGAQYNLSNTFEITPSTAANGTTFTTPAFVINTSNNVGIGTTSPSARLHVAGATGEAIIQDSDTVKASNPSALLSLWGSDARAGYIGYPGDSNMYINQVNNNAMLFLTNNTERMRIDSSGNVTIAAPASGNALTVTGNLAATSINSTPIGGTTTAAGAFTTLTASSSLAVGGVAVVTTARTVSVSGTGLSGGGDLSANRTITIDQTAMKCKNLSSGGTGTAMTAQSGGTASGGSDGDIILIY